MKKIKLQVNSTGKIQITESDLNPEKPDHHAALRIVKHINNEHILRPNEMIEAAVTIKLSFSGHEVTEQISSYLITTGLGYQQRLDTCLREIKALIHDTDTLDNLILESNYNLPRTIYLHSMLVSRGYEGNFFAVKLNDETIEIEKQAPSLLDGHEGVKIQPEEEPQEQHHERNPQESDGRTDEDIESSETSQSNNIETENQESKETTEEPSGEGN